jgi:predicted O-methyltransferase YrrM
MMPVARTWNGTRVVTTLHDSYLDRLGRWSDIQEYLPFLYETAKSYDKVRVLELGTRTGNSTVAFLAAAEAVNGHVTSVDIDPLHPEMHFLAECPRWTFIQGSDLEVQVPLEVDVLFIDTSHEYEHTLAELRAYIPGVRGTALFHDTNVYWNAARTVVSSLVPLHGEKIPPVTQALDDYCKETGLSWENLPGEYGLGMIRI